MLALFFIISNLQNIIMKINLPGYFMLILLLLLGSKTTTRAQEINLEWKERKDLNILLPNSVKVWDTSGNLADGEPVRAMYAVIDLTDENLKLRVVGSNKIKQTTLESYEQFDGILAINGGYFSSSASESLIISDGEVISQGPSGNITKGAFGMVRGQPQIKWINSKESPVPFKYNLPEISKAGEEWNPAQAVGGGPVLIKNGKIKITSQEEGFGGSHLLRHPRTAIGYKDQNTLLLMVVDGRQQASVGVTLSELAQLMINIGAIEALNLDGGGSSAMVAANEVVNIPSDISGGNRNSLRKNASAIVLSRIFQSDARKMYHFDTDAEAYTEFGVWKNSNQVNYYGDNPSRIASAENKFNKAVYQFDDIQQNKYQLSAWWTVNPDENTSEAVYVVHHGSKTDTLAFDQTELSHSGKWQVLGTYTLGAGDKLEVLSSGKKGMLVTDAIRLVSVKNSPELPKRGDVRIAVISDLNSGLGAADYEWQVDSIINRIPRIWHPDLVISGGDMVAGMGINDTIRLQKMWDAFEMHIAKPLQEANIPFAFTLGNHDGPRSYPIEHNFTRNYWNKSANKPDLAFVDAAHFPNYYSFLKDDIFFVSWEASSSEITEENLKWMKEQFSTEQAKNARLRFVMGHIPLYSSAQERDSKGNVLENPEQLRRLLEENNVHTYISGHQHAYYPAKRGRLELLNTGAAGSGERSWLKSNKKPENTITIMDVFYEKDTIIYSTYNIKEKNAKDMQLFNEKELPSAMFGINGHMLRRDIISTETGNGILSSLNTIEKSTENASGTVSVKIEDNKLIVSGSYSNLQGKLVKDNPVGLYHGRNTESGELISQLKIRGNKKSGSFQGKFDLTEDLRDFISIGALYVQINTVENPNGALRAQIYPESNYGPFASPIISHNSRNVYGVRDLEALYEVKWNPFRDDDGDFISYIYQLAKDSAFNDVIFQRKTGQITFLKMTEQEWFQFLGNEEEGKPVEFYHRVIATDGSNKTSNSPALLKLMKVDEPLDDLIEITAPNYEFEGKIENASGAGYGAEWDKDGKLWLADYNKGLIIKNKDGDDAEFSPLTQVEINNEIYNLKPLNGIGVDLEGNILVGRNRHLIKINSKTGKGIAVWEVPEGNRAITAPRVSITGEIYVMSLFAGDGNYILDPSTFDIIRKLELKDRNLSRTFDMTRDGKTLYFPDPGSPKVQKYTSVDGISYKKEKDISSLNAGSSAIQIIDNALFSATRSNGNSPSTIHYRDEEQQRMWTLNLPEVNGAEPRGIGVSPDKKIIIFCSWDKGGGFYKYVLKE